jgi:hypothetical protein
METVVTGGTKAAGDNQLQFAMGSLQFRIYQLQTAYY